MAAGRARTHGCGEGTHAWPRGGRLAGKHMWGNLDGSGSPCLAVKGGAEAVLRQVRVLQDCVAGGDVAVGVQ